MLTESPAIRTGIEQVLKQDSKGSEQVSPASDTPKSPDGSPVVCVTASGSRPLRQPGSAAFHRHKLYCWDEVPPVLQFNPYIKSGYRAGLSCQECLGTLFQYHNETGNIWVHLTSLLACIAIVAAGMVAPLPLAGSALLSLLLPVMLCLAGSVTYHTMMANHWNYKLYITMDVCGVFALFLSGAHNFIWMGLFCYPRLRNAAVTAYFVTAGTCAIMGVTAKSIAKRAIPMLVLLLLRCSILLTRLYLKSGSYWGSLNFCWMEVLTCIGAIVNVKRIPEKWFHDQDPRMPGRFDYWLNSHQIMHILVAWAMAHYGVGATFDYMHFAQAAECPAWELML